MVFYPFYRELQDFADSSTFIRGNFGLWYNKLIPNTGQSYADSWCACDRRGDKNGKTKFYKDVYHTLKKNSELAELLAEKHNRQMHYLEYMGKNNLCCVSFTGRLKSALITGLGGTHPSETSIILDHTLGIPYLPASGIKGVVRYSHLKLLLFDENGKFTERFVDKKTKQTINENDPESHIPLFFGGDIKISDNLTETLMGSIIFLDAYPVSLPEMKTDIINPHYPNYYGDKSKPPGDYQDPVPVKFLTVAPETQFMFRFVLNPESSMHKDQFINAVKDALGNEGLGAKTAIGYGRFRLNKTIPGKMRKIFNDYLKSILSKEEKEKQTIENFITRVLKLEKAEKSKAASSLVDSLFSEWKNSINKVDTEFMYRHPDIAKAFETKVKKRKKKGFSQKYQTICDILGKQLVKASELETVETENTVKKVSDPEIVAKLERTINRGFCTRKEKNRILENHKKDYPDLCSKIKQLPLKKIKAEIEKVIKKQCFCKRLE